MLNVMLKVQLKNFKTLKMANINHDEGPDVGGDYGPYVQSERKALYEKYAELLVEKKSLLLFLR